MFHCWNAGILYGRSRGDLRDGEQRRERPDIRKTDTLASKCRSLDVICLLTA